MYWYEDHMSGWGYGLMTLSMVLFWGLLLTGTVLLVRWLGRDGRRSPGADPPSPQQLLAERFARGEIDEDDYRRRLETLRRTDTGARQ